MKKWISFCFLFFLLKFSYAQRTVSITIDDVPNTKLYEAEHFSSPLLKTLDSLHIHVAIFINEANLQQSLALERNKNLLKSWLVKDYITAGNHGYAHKNYAEIGFAEFQKEVTMGEVITKQILHGLKKESRYFRFPFNAAGNDSLEYITAQNFLHEKNYIATPFTIESEDWLHAILYDKALAENDIKKAEWIGNEYVNFTLRLFAHFDSLSITLYKRPVKQIYLCHDNKLNADYLGKIVNQLKKQEYKFISLGDALNDPVYRSPIYYYGKAGFSWFYRWMPDVAMRKKLMRAEPGDEKIQKAFEELNGKK